MCDIGNDPSKKLTDMIGLIERAYGLKANLDDLFGWRDVALKRANISTDLWNVAWPQGFEMIIIRSQGDHRIRPVWGRCCI